MKQIILTLSIIFLLTSCKKEDTKNKENVKSTQVTESKVETPEEVVLTEKDLTEKQIFDFIEKNQKVTEESYKELFEIIKEDYLLNKDTDKYSVIIHIAKKGLKEKDLDMKNEIYNNLKTEFLKTKK